MTEKKSVPSEYYPQWCQACISLDIHITGIGEMEMEIANVGMMGAPIVASKQTKADYAFICPSCDDTLLVYEDD